MTNNTPRIHQRAHKPNQQIRVTTDHPENGVDVFTVNNMQEALHALANALARGEELDGATITLEPVES